MIYLYPLGIPLARRREPPKGKLNVKEICKLLENERYELIVIFRMLLDIFFTNTWIKSSNLGSEQMFQHPLVPAKYNSVLIGNVMGG